MSASRAAETITVCSVPQFEAVKERLVGAADTPGSPVATGRIVTVPVGCEFSQTA